MHSSYAQYLLLSGEEVGDVRFVVAEHAVYFICQVLAEL